jgi:uncharacterized protein YkwD
MRALYVGFLAISVIIAGYFLYFGSISSGVSVEPQVLAASSSVASVEQQLFLDKVNEVRLSAGVEKLSYDTKLENLTDYRVEDMVARNYYSHKTPELTTYADYFDKFNINSSFSCENLQLQIGPDVYEAVDAWINSSSHYECLVDSRLKTVAFNYDLHETVFSQGSQKNMYVFAMIAAN